MAKSLPNKISFIEPLYALGVRNLPEGPDWLYEIKLDGYRCLAGRAWVKYKVNKGQELVVGVYTSGNPFDAVIGGYYGGDKLLYAGKVRAGFVPHTRREIITRMKPLETNVCRFANLPEKERRTQWALTRKEMKNSVWLEPELALQIEFTEWTQDDHLRHAAFAGTRPDKKARAAWCGTRVSSGTRSVGD